MSIRLDNARRLYLEGIKEGNIDVVKQYTGARYTQHSTGVRDGADGFIEFFKGFLERTTTRDIRLIRAIEDGPYVFVHAYQDIDNGQAKWITTDLFDTDEEGKIIEHWDVIAPYVAPQETASGHDVILGDFELKDVDKTEQNKALVRSFLVEVFQNGHHERIHEYVSDSLINHSAHVEDGITALKAIAQTRSITYDFVFKVIGQGDHVVAYSKVILNQQEHALFDIFRLEDGKIIEHWDNIELIPPREEWANTGKF